MPHPLRRAPATGTFFLLLGACLYPSYTFDLPVGVDGSGTSGQGGQENSNGLGTSGSSTTAGMGGNSVTAGMSGNSATAGMGGNSATAGTGGAAPILDPCAAPTSPSVLFVHAQNGLDTHDGSCKKPFKTIRHALEVATASIAIDTVHLLGNPAGQPPLVYSKDTGETFPLSPPRSLFTLEGDSADTLLLQGGGVCGQSGACTVLVTQSNFRLANLKITDPIGAGVVAVDLDGIVLEQVTVTNCVGPGVEISQSNRDSKRPAVTFLKSTITKNITGVRLNTGGALTFAKSNISENAQAGIFASGGIINSSNSVISDNVGNGIELKIGSDRYGSLPTVITSFNDKIERNFKNGIRQESFYFASKTELNITGSSISNNQEHGIHSDMVGSFKLDQSTLLENGGNGVWIDDIDNPTPEADLAGVLITVGKNVLQSQVRPNGGVGICNNSVLSISADGNHFAACPPTLSSSCILKGDIGGSKLPTINGCLTP